MKSKGRDRFRGRKPEEVEEEVIDDGLPVDPPVPTEPEEAPPAAKKEKSAKKKDK